MIVPYLKLNGKYSLLNLGQPFYNPLNEYDFLDFFYDGFARVKIEEKWNFIDSSERFLSLQFDYTETKSFVNGLAAVKRDKLWYFINRNGIEVTRSGYDSYEILPSGFIHVGDYVIEDWYYGLLDQTGYEIITPTEQYFIHLQKNFILLNCFKGCYCKHKGIDFNREEIFCNNEFDIITSFYNDIALGIKYNVDGVFIITKTLSVLKFIANVELQGYNTFYEGHFGFLDGLCVLKSGKKYGLINLEGEVILDFKYDYLDACSNGLLIVGKLINEKNKYGILNSCFEVILDFIYDEICEFSEGFAVVKNNDKYGLINTDGVEIIPIEYTKIESCLKGFIKVGLGDYYDNFFIGQYGLYNSIGKKICSIIYSDIEILNERLAMIKYDGKCELITNKGIIIANKKYDSIFSHFHEFYFVEKSSKKFVINEKGEEFTEDFFSKKDMLPF